MFTFKQLSRMYLGLSSSELSFVSVFQPHEIGDFTRVSYPQVNQPFRPEPDGG